MLSPLGHRKRKKAVTSSVFWCTVLHVIFRSVDYEIFQLYFVYNKAKREQKIPSDSKAAYRRWSNLKVPVIARKVEACILRCKWLVRLKPMKRKAAMQVSGKFWTRTKVKTIGIFHRLHQSAVPPWNDLS